MRDTNYPSYLEPLNPEQKQAVLHTGKPLLILAGAGSGKTRVITTKIAWLIREHGMDPRSILAVTFTNKAAREMAERARLIEKRAGEAMLRTFHSFGAWFLRRNGSLAGLNSNFVIYDDDDVISLLSGIMENTPKAEVKQCAHNISRAKDYFLCPDDPLLAQIDHRKKFREIFARYEEKMEQIGNVDFGDLIKKPTEILRGFPEVAKRFHERFKVIMVDEYQDANVAQFRLLKELYGPETYVCVVGDDDQSIYRFRGAEVKNILEFPDRFSGADIIRLERNYRSTSPILKAASSVVDYNQGRLGKTLYAERGDGPLPSLVYLPDQDEEANFCANVIENSVKKGETSYSDWAILYRVNAQSLGFETLFLRKGIPYRVVGSLKFYEREEIKDALALLSFLVNPRDEVAFRRMVNKPARSVGPVTVDKIVDAAGDNNGDILGICYAQREIGKEKLEISGERLTNVNVPELSQKARAGLDAFVKVIEEGQTLLDSIAVDNVADNVANEAVDEKVSAKKKKSSSRKQSGKSSDKKNKLVSGEGLSVLVTKLVNSSGIAEYHEAQDEVAGNSRISNLQELVNAASEYQQSREGLLEFLEDIELDRSMEDKSSKSGNAQDTVTFITFHNTKGLEFKRVIMTGLEQGVFPRENKKGEDIEEERRLFYVGVTRAMDELFLTTCAVRRMYGKTMPSQPSLFLREIDRNFLNIENNSGSNTRAGYKRTPVSMPGRNFNPLNLNDTSISKKDQLVKELEERAGWKRGQRLFHDDHGYGAVMDVRDSDDGPVVRVRFDSGKETLFLSEYQSRAFEKMGEDS